MAAPEKLSSPEIRAVAARSVVNETRLFRLDGVSLDVERDLVHDVRNPAGKLVMAIECDKVSPECVMVSVKPSWTYDSHVTR